MVPQSWICSTLTECRYRDILSLFAPSVRYPDSLHFVRPQIRCLGFAPRYVGSDFSPFGLCILTTTLSGLIAFRPSANPLSWICSTLRRFGFQPIRALYPYYYAIRTHYITSVRKSAKRK